MPMEEPNTCDLTSMDRMMDAAQDELSQKNTNDEIALNGRPVPIPLKRQPTIYPHGLNISVHTISTQNEEYKRYTNYSRACTLRSDSTLRSSQGSEQNSHRKYRISMIGNPENLAELQVRRYKYPLTGNYYLDHQDQITKVPWIFEYYESAKQYLRWKYIRWPVFFIASVLLFFGLITYCIWLHDVSVTRQRYLQQRRFQFGLSDLNDSDDSNEIGVEESSSKERQTTLSPEYILSTIKTSTTKRSHILQESTLLRAIGTISSAQDRPKEQTLTTKDYDASKVSEKFERGRDKFKPVTKTTLPTEGPTVVNSNEEDDYASLERVHFTSGHQNGFGVPVEDDERLFHIIHGINIQDQSLSTAIKPQTRVSPTIPPILHFTPTIPMNFVSRPTVSLSDNRCYSTSLSMCRGVLDYDLTYNSTTAISPAEQAAYEELVNSNCSARTLEFICALLEPECRPSHIGVLPPCRRICKAVLEACSILIANSDILSETFDCSLLPESNDPQKCEDTTRRSDYCYDNEFECYDNTCIPQQWQCDNIKDCATGEDEDECLQCDQEEFRCRSNDKCVPESVRCDLKLDCFDGSDEDDCEDYGSGDESSAAFDEAALNSFPRMFSYASYLSPNQTNKAGQFTYITDDETGTKFEIHDLTNRTSGVSKEDVTNNVPGTDSKGFVNFRDSKEIMMTSDSENKFKYSSIRGNRTGGNRYSTPSPSASRTTVKLQPAASQIVARTSSKPLVKSATTCAPHQLRCVSGKCITVAQLCDKKIDCPDGADELMCNYKEQRSTTKGYNGTNNSKTNMEATTPDSTRHERRTSRTTFKRKLKV